MDNDITLLVNASYYSVVYDEGADSWRVQFSNNISLVAQTFWRLLHDDKIWLVSLDHGHQFGRTTPKDIAKELSNLLDGKMLLEAVIKKDTGDLFLLMTDNFQIEVFISSSGYESYDLQVEGISYIGMGSGEIAIIDRIV